MDKAVSSLIESLSRWLGHEREKRSREREEIGRARMADELRTAERKSRASKLIGRTFKAVINRTKPTRINHPDGRPRHIRLYRCPQILDVLDVGGDWVTMLGVQVLEFNIQDARFTDGRESWHTDVYLQVLLEDGTLAAIDADEVSESFVVLVS